MVDEAGTSGTEPFQKATFFIYLATFFVSRHIFMYHCYIFLCVQKSHKYGVCYLKIVVSHMNKMRIFSPFIVIVLSPFIWLCYHFYPWICNLAQVFNVAASHTQMGITPWSITACSRRNGSIQGYKCGSSYITISGFVVYIM